MIMDLVQRGRAFVDLYDPKKTVGHGLVDDLTAEVVRLRRELMAARADAERLDWLDFASWSDNATVAIEGLPVMSSLRAAIDAAKEAA